MCVFQTKPNGSQEIKKNTQGRLKNTVKWPPGGDL